MHKLQKLSDNISEETSVTGLVLTLNGAKYLERCLKSLDFCQELLVVDSGSTDETQNIASACGAKVLVNAWEGPAKQFAFAFEHISTPWVVSLDQDEILSPELRTNIMNALAAPEKYNAFLCPRTSFYYDRFLRHSGWYPDLLPRVFRLDRTKVHVSGPHYGFRPQEPTQRLQGDILHYPYENMRQHVEKINYYTQIAAEEMHERGKNSGITTAFLHGLARFLKVYFFRRGFLDGTAGFVLAVNSFFYAFQKYARLAEMRTNPAILNKKT